MNKNRKKKEGWKGMPVSVACSFNTGDMIILVYASGYIKPKRLILSRTEFRFFGKALSVEVSSYVGEKRVEIKDENGEIVYIANDHGVGRDCTELLGRKKEIVYRVDGQKTLYELILGRPDHFKSREEIIIELRRQGVNKRNIIKYSRFLRTL